MNNAFDTAIIGGGPAGMMAGIAAKTDENNIVILEKNQSLGKKLLLTGKGRYNLTTAGKKGKFLYGALTRFSNKKLIIATGGQSFGHKIIKPCPALVPFKGFGSFLKDFSFEITGVMPLKAAIITSGGIDINCS